MAGGSSSRLGPPPLSAYSLNARRELTDSRNSYDSRKLAMAGHPINAQKYLVLAFKHGLETQPQIADASDVSPKTVWTALRGKPISQESRRALAKAVGLEDDREILAGPASIESAKRPRNEFGGSTTVLDPAVMRGKKLQDVKLVLDAPRLSKALLAGKNAPSFAECVEKTNLWTPVDDRHKDYPFLPGKTFNHFIQLGVVVALDIQDEARIIGYTRRPRPQVPSQVHTKGRSILFGFSSWAHIGRHKHDKSLLDAWLDTVDEQNQAERALVGGAAPIILQLATQKIDLLDHKCRIVPFGVITRDERGDSFKRVYTQFVFHVIVSVATKNIDRFVMHIPTSGLEISRLPDNIKPEKIFVGEKGRLNTMDIVAWNALHSNDEKIVVEHTVFSRSFKIA
jgi:hypothetical protein